MSSTSSQVFAMTMVMSLGRCFHRQSDSFIFPKPHESFSGLVIVSATSGSARDRWFVRVCLAGLRQIRQALALLSTTRSLIALPPGWLIVRRMLCRFHPPRWLWWSLLDSTQGHDTAMNDSPGQVKAYSLHPGNGLIRCFVRMPDSSSRAGGSKERSRW